MNLAKLSVTRPVFITCVVIMILALGAMSLTRLGVDMFPDVTFPVVTVTVAYPGAGPQEIETQISKVLEEELSSLSGVKGVRSINREGVTTVVVEFTLETDVKYAEQQVKDRVNASKRKLPTDSKDAIIRRIDPGDQPILFIAVSADMPNAELYDLANERIRPRFEQTDNVGLVEVIGGRKREVRVELDRAKLKSHEISASQVAQKIQATGINVPAGKVSANAGETVFRTLGEFKSLADIESTVVNFVGNDVPIRVKDLGRVVDTIQDETAAAYQNGKQSLFIMVFRQSGANTIAVSTAVKAKIDAINKELSDAKSPARMTVVRDMSKYIRANVEDVQESIFFGILLTIFVVYLFLANARSTLITGAALPNSLLGAFILMAAAGFTINVMTLLALSLAVGLLIDDAIVVRENIFRRQEMGDPPDKAAILGTQEVTLAVVATTLTVIAVFGPIGFLQGVVGQFFKQFGLTICFAMMISLFDALTVAPMLSAYFPAKHQKHKKGPMHFLTAPVRAFERFQVWLENRYEGLLRYIYEKPVFRPLVVMFISVAVFVVSVIAAKYVPKTFLPAQDMGEFGISLELPPGTSLEAMKKTTLEVDSMLRANKEVLSSVITVGSREGESNVAEFNVELVPRKQRTVDTLQFKDIIREQLKKYAHANPRVKDVDVIGGGIRPFNVFVMGSDMEQLQKVSKGLFDKLKDNKGLKDVETSDKAGRPEFQVAIENDRIDRFGISSVLVGNELRAQVEGVLPAVYREKGIEYDIRVRLQDDQRDLKSGFEQTYVPNLNYSLVKLSNIAKPVQTTGPATINRQDRGRYISIGADIAPNGPGMAAAMDDVKNYFEKEAPLPTGMRYRFIGQAEDFAALMVNMITAMGLGVLFIYLVLASLYESFVTPLTIMLVLPLALCGAFFALFVTGKSFDLFSMIGCIMLLGIATKNSILLVDKTIQLLNKGMGMTDAIVEAGKNRLRPILMTSFALIAGMLPVAIGLNKASRQRTAMGVAVIGGLITSTILSLLVIPAAFSFIERSRRWILRFTRRWAGLDAKGSNGASSPDDHEPDHQPDRKPRARLEA